MGTSHCFLIEGEGKMNRKIRVLISKPGIDGHWRGGVVVSRGLRDSGMEVIYGGFQNVEQIVQSAIMEDVDVIGLSIHSGAHVEYTKRVIDMLEEKGLKEDFLIVVGGVIPVKDFPIMEEMGVGRVFGPGSEIKDIADYIISEIDE